MKRAIIALFLFACLPLLYGQKTRYGQEPPMTAKPAVDYTVKVHISGIRTRRDCSSGACFNALHADAVIDQRKLELTGSFLYDPKHVQVDPVPGDYMARPLKVPKKDPSARLYYEYELLLTDRHVWRCAVTGIFE